MDFNREQHVDLRIQKTHEAIENTFREMICDMPAEKIIFKEQTGKLLDEGISGIIRKGA